MKYEKLMRAIGEIDEDLIAEAHEEKRAKLIWVRFAACAACVALVAFAVPNVLDMMGAGAAMEMDQIEAPLENMEALSPETDRNFALEETPSSSADSKVEAEWDKELSDMGQAAPDVAEGVKMQLALDEQNGLAYPLGVSVEKEYGKVMFTNRSKSTVTMKLSLLRDYGVKVYSVSSGVWSLTVNGEKAEDFPNKAGVYEIVIDVSRDNPPDMVFVEGFGMFSWDYEIYK